MSRNKAQVFTDDSGIANKLILGFAGAMVTTVVGVAGIAAAAHSTTSSDPPTSGTPSVVAMCKARYQQLGYKNVGQCVSHNNGHGHGYGK